MDRRAVLRSRQADVLRASDRESKLDFSALSGADRVLATLKAVGGYPWGVTLDELQRRVGLPKSSLHRILATLRRAAFVEQDSTGRFRLGLELIRIAHAYDESRDDGQLMRPLLHDLAERFGETAHVARLDGSEIVYLAKVSPARRGTQMTSTIGGRNPAHCTGVGKVLLAYTLVDDSQVDKFVTAYSPLVRRTPHSLTSATQLKREMRRIRAQGYSTDAQESELGINCIAFALFLDSRSTPAAAVSIAALAPRTPLPKLVQAAGEIRRMIGKRLGDVLPARVPGLR